MARRTYIWERPTWPAWEFDAARLLVPLGTARRAQGELDARIASLGFDDRSRIELDARTDEAVETTEIEGEPVSRADVRSSIARRLDLDRGGVPAAVIAPGVVDLTLDATVDYASPLTRKRIDGWHAGLFPLVAGRRRSIAIGTWRDDATGPMQVVSGRIDAPVVHFEAPPARRIAPEMAAFLAWFEGPTPLDGLVRSALAHLWFVTIHPYDDGNGRIARAIADMALGRDAESGRRYFSMARQINAEKRRYYDAIEAAQRGDLDVTEWLAWYLATYVRAIDTTSASTADAFRAHAFWRAHDGIAFSERQRRILDRTLHGFEGNLTAKKWAALAKTSIDTAQRDVADLVSKGVLRANPGGSKKTSYALIGYTEV